MTATVEEQKAKVEDAAKALASVGAPADLVAEVRRLKARLPLEKERPIPAPLVKLVDLARLLTRDAPRKGAVAHRILSDIENAEVYGRGRSYDGGGRESAKWCEKHEDDKCSCEDKVPLPERSDPVGDMIVRGLHDPAEATRYRRDTEFLERVLVENMTSLMEKWHEVAGYATGDIPVPDSVDRPSRGGHCLACDRYVAGTESDRLRSGLCDADRTAFKRDRSRAAQQGRRLERQEWLIGRRKDLAARAIEEPERVDPTEVSPVAHVEVTYMATGEQLTLTPEQVAVWRTLNVEQQREFAAALGGGT